MLVAGFFSFIGDSVKEAILGFLLLIDSLVYTVIGWLYQLFLVIASYRLFDNDMYESLTNGIYTIIGVVVLFIIAYELLGMMISPDEAKSGEQIKKIIISFITSILLIILVPTIFNFLFDFQNSILNHNVLGKLLLPSYSVSVDEFNEAINEKLAELEEEIDDDTGVEMTKVEITDAMINYYTLQIYGNQMAVELFQAFFYPTGATNTETLSSLAESIEVGDPDSLSWLVNIATHVVGGVACASAIAVAAGITIGTLGAGSISIGGAVAVCGVAVGSELVSNIMLDAMTSKITLAEAYTVAEMTGDFSVFQRFSGELVGDVEDISITYNYIISTIVGLIVIYILAIYCIDLGVRAVKLAFYQIIAPIPIFMRIIPKQEKVFDNWWKAVLTTYAEVFIRMFFLYLAVFFFSYLPTIMNNIFGTNSAYTESLIIYLLVRVVIIVGILIFIRRLPEQIEEVTGIKSSNFSLKIMDHLKEAAWAPAAVGGLVTGHGNPMSMLRAGANGWKNNNLQGIGEEVIRRRNLEEARINGSTWTGRMSERGRRLLGLETGVEQADRALQEGIDPSTGRAFRVQNDTTSDINITDANGYTISTVNVGEDVEMDREMQEQILTTKQYNAQALSRYAEELRGITDSEASNSQLISLRSAIKEEALDKISEEKSELETSITTRFGSYSGNMYTLRKILEQRVNQGASEAEINELSRAVGKAEDELWEAFADASITGIIRNGNVRNTGTTLINNDKIKNISAQMDMIFANNGLQSDAGIAYDRKADRRGLNMLDGIARVNALDTAAKEYNNGLVLDKQDVEIRQSGIKAQEAGLDRLSAQLKEQQEVAKRSDKYRARQADVSGINNNKNSGGRSQ